MKTNAKKEDKWHVKVERWEEKHDDDDDFEKKSSNDLVQGSSATARDQSHNLATARRPISLSFTSATHTASFVFRKPPTPSCIPSSQHVNDHIEVVGRQAAANDQSRNLSRDGRLNKLLCLISEPAKRGNVARHQPVAAAHPFLRSQRHGTPPLHDGWRRPLKKKCENVPRKTRCL